MALDWHNLKKKNIFVEGLDPPFGLRNENVSFSNINREATFIHRSLTKKVKFYNIVYLIRNYVLMCQS